MIIRLQKLVTMATSLERPDNRDQSDRSSTMNQFSFIVLLTLIVRDNFDPMKTVKNENKNKEKKQRQNI